MSKPNQPTNQPTNQPKETDMTHHRLTGIFKRTAAATKKAGVIELSGLEQEASECRKLARQLDQLKAEYAIARRALADIASTARTEQLQQGTPVRTVRISTSDGPDVLVMFTERYHGVSDPEQVAVARDLLGDSSVVTHRITFRSGVTPSAVRHALGDAYSLIEGLVEETATAAPAKGAIVRAAGLYAEGKDAEAELLLEFVSACSQTPTVRTK